MTWRSIKDDPPPKDGTLQQVAPAVWESDRFFVYKGWDAKKSTIFEVWTKVPGRRVAIFPTLEDAERYVSTAIPA